MKPWLHKHLNSLKINDFYISSRFSIKDASLSNLSVLTVKPHHLVDRCAAHYVVVNNPGIDLWQTPHLQATKIESHQKKLAHYVNYGHS